MTSLLGTNNPDYQSRDLLSELIIGELIGEILEDVVKASEIGHESSKTANNRLKTDVRAACTAPVCCNAACTFSLVYSSLTVADKKIEKSCDNYKLFPETQTYLSKMIRCGGKEETGHYYQCTGEPSGELC